MPTSSRFNPAYLPAIIVIVLLLVATGAWQERLAIYDWSRLQGYTPPAAVQQLAADTTMTPYAQHLFYVYHPQLESAAAFNRNCHVGNQVIVLGCTVNFQGIYLYNVTDPQLAGITQATAAYEMLHVAYARLSTSERARIDALVQTEFNVASAVNPHLATEEQSYLKTEGAAAVPNELHSMMGTEVTNLPPELASYYAQYFTNRQVIIGYENQYQGTLTKLQTEVSTDESTLALQKSTISADEAALTTADQELAAQKGQLDQLLDSGQSDAYNTGVPVYNTLVQNHNTLLDQTRDAITEYNLIVSEHNAAAQTIGQLYQDLSSQPLNSLTPPIPSQ